MIANLFFSLIAAGFAAEAAAKARYERLWSLLLLGILALLGFNFWENGQLGVVETFAFHWIDTSLMRVDVNLNTDAAVYGLAAPFVLLTGMSVFYNTFYNAETDKLRLNGLLLLNLAAVILVICAQNFMQLLTAVCIADVLCLFMINDIEGKRRYVFYNLLADMGLFTLFALIWKQTGSISLSALSGYHQPGQYPELTVGLLLFCAFIKSGMFLFQGGFLNLAGLSFNRILSVSYCATPLIGILLLIKAYPLLGNVPYAPVVLELFGGLTLLWAFVGAISIDNLKDKALYFNLMFYALMVGLLSLGLNPLLKLLPGLLLAGSLLNILWMMTAVSASNELFVSNMGDFARPLKTVFVLALLLTFALVQGITEAAAPQNERWVYVFAVVLLTALAHVLYQIFLGKTNADERVWAFLKNPPLLFLFPVAAAVVFMILQSGFYHAGVWYVYAAFLLVLFSGPLRRLRRLYDSEAVQEADWFDDMYETLLVAPVKILGRILWLTIDFLIIERTIVSSLSGGTALLVRILDRMHTGTWAGSLLYVSAGLLIAAAAVYVKVNG